MISPVFILANLSISPEESQGFIGFRSVASPPQKFPCVRDNSKRVNLSQKYAFEQCLSEYSSVYLIRVIIKRR